MSELKRNPDLILVCKDLSIANRILALKPLGDRRLNASPVHGYPAESLLLVKLYPIQDTEEMWWEARFKVGFNLMPPESRSQYGTSDYSVFEEWHTLMYAVWEWDFPEEAARKLILSAYPS